MNVHWESFCQDVSWFVGHRTARVGDSLGPGTWRPSSAEFEASFPKLSRLLASANLSKIVLDEHPYILFSWPADGEFRSWLAESPTTVTSLPLFPKHRVLLASFGGIVERSNEPESSWLLNNNEVLTVAEASHDASFIEDHDWALEDVPGGIPIDLKSHYSIAREANGNDTLCHRVTGNVIMFAADHNFSHVRPLEGCPDYTLYKLIGAPTFPAWVEEVAHQMLSSVDVA
jgi:hypothetical protein